MGACPDPDGANGRAFLRLRDLNGDGRNDSSYQEDPALASGNFHHSRINNTGMAGSQDVKWGMDRDGDGRIDDRNSDNVKVDWSANGLSGSGSSYGW